mmetsp:Transcript_39036/g.93967  ORF Transcript_39036/g.93967 Transcript_39036/m.93967 type:complete len:232 (+) Transcript_39036:1402-2097(+)
MNLRSKRVEDAGKLHGDVPRSDDNGHLWEFLHIEETVGRDAVLLYALAGREVRPASRGDDDLPGGVPSFLAALIRHPYGVSVDKAALPVNSPHTRLFESVGVNLVQTFHVPIANLLQFGKVQLCFLPPLESVVVHVVLQRVGDVRGAPHDLLGHAADVDAGAAEAHGAFDVEDRGAVGRGALGARDSAGAAPDGDEIVIVRVRWRIIRRHDDFVWIDWVDHKHKYYSLLPT